MTRNRIKSDIKKLADKHILVVEDHPFVGEILTELLTRYDHPSHANSGKEALRQIKQKRPNIILLDLSLPDINGLELAKLVRQNKRTKSIRILAMSATRVDRRKWLQAGCNDFILKPFSTPTLLARLSKLAA
jgi:two-component system alkaline phosphatase synthesis response regulator PhoP